MFGRIEVREVNISPVSSLIWRASSINRDWARASFPVDSYCSYWFFWLLARRGRAINSLLSSRTALANMLNAALAHRLIPSAQVVGDDRVQQLYSLDIFHPVYLRSPQPSRFISPGSLWSAAKPPGRWRWIQVHWRPRRRSQMAKTTCPHSSCSVNGHMTATLELRFD